MLTGHAPDFAMPWKLFLLVLGTVRMQEARARLRLLDATSGAIAMNFGDKSAKAARARLEREAYPEQDAPQEIVNLARGDDGAE